MILRRVFFIGVTLEVGSASSCYIHSFMRQVLRARLTLCVVDRRDRIGPFSFGARK